MRLNAFTSAEGLHQHGEREVTTLQVEHNTLAKRPRWSAAAARVMPERLALAALLAIVVGALWLRWQSLDYVEFTGDQAWVLNRAYDMVTGRDLPLTGIVTSMGPWQGPLEIYLLALPVAISRDPRLATAFVGLLQVGAIIGAYLLGRRYFGLGVGLAAAALFAANPWALQYSRKVWTPNLLPLFTVILFAALLGSLVERRRWPAALALACQAAMFLIHPSSIVLAPLLALVLLWRLPTIGLRPLAAGCGAALLIATPYLVAEWRSDFHSLRMYLAASATPATVDLEGLQLLITLASARMFPVGMGYGFRGEWSLPSVALPNELSTWLLYLGLAACLWRVLAGVRRGGAGGREWQPYLLLLLWFAVPALATVRHSLTLHPHYFVGVYPAQFLLIGVGLLALMRGFASLGRARQAALTWLPAALATAAVLSVIVPEVAYFREYLRLVETNGPTRLYGVPLRFTQEAVDKARDLRARFGGAPVYAYSFGQNHPLTYLARPDLPLRSIDPPEGFLLPRDTVKGALFLLASDDGNLARIDYRLVDPAAPTINRLRALGFAEVPDSQVVAPDGYVYYRFFYITPAALAAALASFTVPAAPLSLANGMALLGYAHPSPVRADEDVELALLWQLPDHDPADPYREHNLFVHVLDRRGGQVAGQDRELVPYLTWRAGDLVLTYHELHPPADRAPGLFWFDIGAYTRFDRRDVPWLDAAGRPLAMAARIGPLNVRPQPQPRAPTTPAAATFGNQLQLLGYDLAQAAPGAGTAVDLTLHWTAKARPNADYVVSVQLLAGDSRLLAQHDAEPAHGDYPTTAWQPGDVVLDPHHLDLPPETAGGDYSLTLVVYDRATQRRLPVFDAAGRPQGDHLRLAALSVR